MFFTSRKTSIPPRPGMLISKTRRDVWDFPRRPSTSSPLPASENSAPGRASARISRRPRRTTAWSSAIRICIFGSILGAWCVVTGNPNTNPRPVARGTGNEYVAPAELGSLFHAQKPQRPDRLRQVGFTESYSVILHDEKDVLIV